MYEIKVTVTNTVPSFMDKLNALDMTGAKAEALININDNLRIEANKKKYDVIIDTLKPIIEGYEKLAEICHKYHITLYNGLSSKVGGDRFGVRQSVNLSLECGKIRISYYDGSTGHSIYPGNDFPHNYSPKGIITNWEKYHVIEDFERELNKLIDSTMATIKKKEEESITALNTALGM